MYDYHTLLGHSGNVDPVSFSPDGTRILSGSQDLTVKVWDASSGACVNTFPGFNDMFYKPMLFNPDGTRTWSCSSKDKTVNVWEVSTGECVTTLSGHGSSTVSAVSFSPDGSRLVSSGYDKTHCEAVAAGMRVLVSV